MAVPSLVAVPLPTAVGLYPPLQGRERPEGTGYLRVRVARTEQAETNLCRWLPGARTTLHGHAGSAGLYLVLAGSFVEDRYAPADGGGFHFESRLLRAGERSFLPPGCYHRLRALEPALTCHHYTPAPPTTAEPVPPGVAALLERAEHPGRQPDPVEAVAGYLEVWAAREARANDARATRMPAETLADFRASGLLTAPIPVAEGGWGSPLSRCAEAVRRVARRAPSTALALAMPLGNAATARIPAEAVPARRREALAEGKRWIAEKARAGLILAVANSEPGAGGDLKNTRTVAQALPGGRFRLSGRKAFATIGPDADYFLCAARTPEGAIDGFFVSRYAEGVTVDDRWNPAGMRPTASVGLTLDGAEAEALMGYPGCLEGVNARHWSTVLFAAVFLGVGEGALEQALSSADGGWARSALADCRLELDAAAGFLEAVAADERWPLPAEAQERTRRLKTFVARTSAKAAMQAAMIGGGRSYGPDHPAFRMLCDALAGPLLRPPLPQAMDAIVKQLFPPAEAEGRRAA